MKINMVRVAIISLLVVQGLLSVVVRADTVEPVLAPVINGSNLDAQGTRRALLVGINVYAPAYDPGPLPSCVNDAMGVRNTILLADPGQRCSASSVQVLKNNFATYGAIRAALQSLATASQPGDLALYTHSSHGGQYSGTSVFLCAYDKDYTAVELGEDLSLFNPGVTVIVLVDACHSGGLFKQKDGWPFAEMTMQSFMATKTKQYQSKGLAVPKALGTNIAFMTACDYSQTCSAGDPYSLYIGSVITGCLDSAVDANKDGLYQFSELHNYAAELATQKNPSQTAQMFNASLLTSVVARSVGNIQVEGDFDGDRKADPYVVDALGNWYIFFSGSSWQSSGAIALGMTGTPVAGDFDGDLKADPAMVDAHGNWYIWFSGSSGQRSDAIALGMTGTPVAGDFDKDGKADPAMVDASGNWYIWFSGKSWQRSDAIALGHAGWKPVTGDFDGDNQADPAMVLNNNWMFYFSTGSFAPSGPYSLVP